MKPPSRYWIIATALALCVFGESMAYTYMQEDGAAYYYSSSILYLLAGLTISVLPLLLNARQSQKTAGANRIQKFIPYIFYLFLIGLFVYHAVYLSDLYNRFEINAKWADMIPMIQVSCRRLLHGLPVYAPTPEIHPGSYSSYLPMMWMPFLPAGLLGFDPRWITVSAVFISLFIAASGLFRNGQNIQLFPVLITGAALFLTLNYFLMKSDGFWAMTEEGVIAGYYILLGYALLRENFYLIGFMMCCCLLSRYSLTMWIPVYLAYLFFTRPCRDFLKVFLAFSISVMLIFVLPWFIWDPLHFLGFPAGEAGGLTWFWTVFDLIEKKFYNVGMYKFFNVNQVWWMVKIELLGSFLLPLLLIVLAKRLQRRYMIEERFITWGSLKICLVCFYNFIPTPYVYLFFPATLMSYAILFDVLSLPGREKSMEAGATA